MRYLNEKFCPRRLRALARPALLLVPLLAFALSAPARAETIMVLGDSLSAAYGIEQQQGWVNLLRERLEARYPGQHEVINASISGDTTAGGLSRLPQALEQHTPDILLLELGGNDGLRGLPPTQMEANLAQMIELGRDAGARVGLLGIRIPPNYGQAYSEAFEGVYTSLAERFDIPLVTFMLEGVALNDDLMQDDGIHPNGQGQPLILDNVWPLVEPLLQASSESRSGASQS